MWHGRPAPSSPDPEDLPHFLSAERRDMRRLKSSKELVIVAGACEHEEAASPSRIAWISSASSQAGVFSSELRGGTGAAGPLAKAAAGAAAAPRAPGPVAGRVTERPASAPARAARAEARRAEAPAPAEGPRRAVATRPSAWGGPRRLRRHRRRLLPGRDLAPSTPSATRGHASPGVATASPAAPPRTPQARRPRG